MDGEKSESQSLRALLGLRDLLLGGQVAPGERLSEVALAQRLGISRTPLRTAFARLEQEGLLEQIPSGGYAARSFSIQDVFDSIELRGVLEGTAARLAAERGVPPARLKAAGVLVAEMDLTFRERPEDMDFARYVTLNSEFHQAIAALSGSEIVQREIERIVRLPFASPSAFLEKQEDVPAFRLSLVHAQRQHRAILEAIALREGSRAEALAREHARLARQNLEFVIDEDRSLIARVPALSLVSP